MFRLYYEFFYSLYTAKYHKMSSIVLKVTNIHNKLSNIDFEDENYYEL